MKRIGLIVAALGLAVTAGSASAADGGASRLSVGLGQGVADGYVGEAVGTGNYLAPTTTPETNVGVEYWRTVGEGVAIAVSGAYGFSSMKWQGEASADPEIKATGTSFKVRIGADRVGAIGDRLVFFMGPGIEYWSGKQKLKVGSSETESETTSRFGVSGRVGGIMMLAEKVGIMGQVGHTFGIAKADDGGAETTWLPSSFNASWGLTFGF